MKRPWSNRLSLGPAVDRLPLEYRPAFHGWLGIAFLGLLLARDAWSAPPPALSQSPATMAVGDPTKLLPVHVTAARAFAGGSTPGWTGHALDDRSWAAAPRMVVPRLSFGLGSSPPDGVTLVDVLPGASLRMRTHFDVERPETARVIELRVTYLDGFVAFLNGAEIARRNLPSSSSEARPQVSHGGDPETIFVPLSPGAAGPAITAKDNLLAVEIRAGLGRLAVDSNAPSGEIDMALASGVRLVRGPYLIAPSEGAVSVVWQTNLPARGDVRFNVEGRDAKSGRHAPAPTRDLRHVVHLVGLEAGRRYRYQVDIEGQQPGDRVRSIPASFETAPARDRPLRFVVYGDMRAPGHAEHAQIVAGIVRERPALVLNTGDLVATGSEESAWQRYFEITAPLGAMSPVVPALGNHEASLGGLGAAKSWGLFGLTSASATPGYTSFDWGGAHFVILDSNHLDRIQRDWLTRDLAAAHRRRPRAIFAVCHDGAWSHGVHGGSRTMEREFAPVLVSGGVDVLFGGHDHLYERGVVPTTHGTLPYVVTGGGGAPLYNPSCQPVLGPVDTAADPSRAGTPFLLPACPPSVAIIRKTFHYLVVEIADRVLRLCPRLPDGSPLEPCVDMPLRASTARKAFP